MPSRHAATVKNPPRSKDPSSLKSESEQEQLRNTNSNQNSNSKSKSKSKAKAANELESRLVSRKNPSRGVKGVSLNSKKDDIFEEKGGDEEHEDAGKKRRSTRQSFNGVSGTMKNFKSDLIAPGRLTVRQSSIFKIFYLMCSLLNFLYKDVAQEYIK
jgi:hypothetical protein